MGSLPAVLGLVVLCTVFGIVRPVFFSPGNIANLFTQGAQVTIIAMGLVFVLLIGEIDLSAGFASGVCAAVLGVTLTNHGWPWYAACLAAIVTGTVIGLILGLLVAKMGIPSFVVTLAAFLAFQGVGLALLKEGTNISIRDEVIVGIGNRNMTPLLSWVLAVVVIVGFTAIELIRWMRRNRRGVTTDPISVVVARIVTVGAMITFLAWVLTLERAANPLFATVKGVPVIVPVIGVMLIVWTFVLRRTAYGRHIYAVGGNAEAARRAGINVDRIKISAFVICSGMAAVGGIVAAGHDSSVDSNTGGSNVLLYAVGAAVIGGTSLFGGRGRMIDAVLGGMVIAVIINGMALLNQNASTKYIITGTVLLLAAGVDALSRRRAVVTR
ncbi:sugar ABC transporter permease [Allocatelliglobosispora scoriae]|nr:ABC transporter permease [Allocatelliglobosispora scoriae]